MKRSKVISIVLVSMFIFVFTTVCSALLIAVTSLQVWGVVWMINSIFHVGYTVLEMFYKISVPYLIGASAVTSLVGLFVTINFIIKECKKDSQDK